MVSLRMVAVAPLRVVFTVAMVAVPWVSVTSLGTPRGHPRAAQRGATPASTTKGPASR